MDQQTNQETTIEKSECLIVSGMHRSGGSLLAKCLHQLGINFGSSLLVGNGSNGDGAFENQDIVLVHEILFRDLGCRWDMVGSLPEGWLESKAAEHASQKITQILEKQFLGDGPWAVKDPRLCRVLPLWSKVLKNLRIKPCFVHMVRHPYEVALSLSQHHDTDVFKGHLLWLVYNRDALRSSQQHRHTLLTYDQFLADPVSLIRKISETVNIDLPCDPLQYSHILTDFARPDLKFNHASDSNASFSKEELAPFAWIYEQFRLNLLKTIESPNEHQKSLEGKAFSDLPLVNTTDSVPQARKGQRHAVEIFNDLLGVIGRYEQAELDQNLLRQRRLLNASHGTEIIYAQLFIPSAGNRGDVDLEKNAKKMLLAHNEWQSVTWDVLQSEYLRTGRLRLDPLNTPGIVSISSVKLINVATGEICWSAREEEQFEQCSIEGDCFFLSFESGLVLVCTGSDARLLLPALPDLPDCPLRLEVWIKASRNQAILNDAWRQQKKKNLELSHELGERQTLLVQIQNQVKELERQISDKDKALQTKEKERQSERILKLSQIKKIKTEVDDKSRIAVTLENKLKLQKELSQQYYTDMQDAEQEYQSKVVTLKKKVYQKQKMLVKFERRLNYQKQLSKQYYTAMQDAEQEYQSKVDTLKKKVYQKQKMLVKFERRLNYQKQLSKQYYTAMQDAEQEYQSKANALQKKADLLEQKVYQKQEVLEETERQLNYQEKLALQYHTALTAAENKLENYQRMGFERKQLNTWMRQLKKAFQSLATSRRWKFGYNAGRIFEVLCLRNKRPTVIDDIQETFKQYDQILKQAGDPPLKHIGHYFHEGEMLLNWMKQLKSDFQAFIGSHRWKWGNFTVRIAETLLLRPRVLLAPEHMESIFSEFDSWQQDSSVGRSDAGYHHKDIERLKKWMRELDNDFQATLASTRWRVGSAMVRLIMGITFRPRKPLVTAHMQEILEDYRNQIKR